MFCGEMVGGRLAEGVAGWYVQRKARAYAYHLSDERLVKLYEMPKRHRAPSEELARVGTEDLLVRGSSRGQTQLDRRRDAAAVEHAVA